MQTTNSSEPQGQGPQEPPVPATGTSVPSSTSAPAPPQTKQNGLIKMYKLIHHQKKAQGTHKHFSVNFLGEDLAFSFKDFPEIGEGDIVEIYNPDEDTPRLLLKVTKGSMRDDFYQKDAISVDQSIATLFQLRAYCDVIIRKVDLDDVELDSVELTFKDQYLGRSDMWRLKNSLLGECIFVGKKLEYSSSIIRCQVHEMWSHGDKVACGVITANTKVVFRSSTSMVYLFIQMSTEMWEFDIYGDLYFEKAVNGFLAELFAKWKKNGCNHEVTIVLFSRIYYQANCLEQFPESMRDCLQTDYRGRFYEDYYRVAVHNGKYEDWGNTLIHLKHLFVEYQSYILGIHQKEEIHGKIPTSVISSAAQGNFLEVLNMSLNVFEKHYKDRSFDRTGQLSVVITPGVGVFEVDRELTNVTMQRIIDNGVGSDLVCVGEQPLHAVPLLKFHNKAKSNNSIEDYSMPHWINLSFYSTNKKVGYSSYTPRIKLPMLSPDPIPATRSNNNNSSTSKVWDWTSKDHYRIHKEEVVEPSWPNYKYDYNDYDNKIFQSLESGRVSRRSAPRKKVTSHQDLIKSKIFKRQNSEPEINQDSLDAISPHNASLGSSSDKFNIFATEFPTTSAAITIPVKKAVALTHLYSSSFGALNIEVKPKLPPSNKDKWFYDDVWTNSGHKLTSPGNSSQSGSPKDRTTVYTRQSKSNKSYSKALINPFDPSHQVIKNSSNRRRWTHIFPRGPSGQLIQQHHFNSPHTQLEIVHEGIDQASPTKSPEPPRSGRSSVTKQASDSNLALMWGATGEQEWTAALETGVDWKSLTIPACLPLTTDYFPDERSIQVDYVVSDYSLLPDDVNAEYALNRSVYRPPLSTKEVFTELVSQRLAQGFQLIVKPPSEKQEKNAAKPPNQSLLRSPAFPSKTEEEEGYFLSIGRVFHKITLEGSKITVTRYRPRHAYPSIKIHYRYRFHAPNNESYEVSSAEFSTEKLENYNWNYLDHYICTRGDKDFPLDRVETIKFWRFRMYLLPNYQLATKRILEGAEYTNIYSKITEVDKSYLFNGFLKFVETCINRVRRPNTSSRHARMLNSVYRERLLASQKVAANAAGDKTRPRIISSRSESGEVTANEIIDVENDKVYDFAPVSEFSPENSIQTMEPYEEPTQPEITLPADMTLKGIIDAMCSSTANFFIKNPDLPINTFVSADAVTWLIEHMVGMSSEVAAISKFNEMITEHLICHASGNYEIEFIFGFELYSVTSYAPESTSKSIPRQDLRMFQNDWMEVEVDVTGVEKGGTSSSMDSSTLSSSFKDCRLDSSQKSDAHFYKTVYLDIDVGKKSDRQEWGHLKYQALYKPGEAFELNVQWVQATGAIITDLILGWARKAQQCNLLLVPIPSDPFALPYSSKSDSLRGPIFVNLNVEALMGNKSYLFQEYPEETWGHRLLMLQQGIAEQFGFIRSMNPTELDPANYYVHFSGNMFIYIPSISALGHAIGCKESSIKQRLQNSPTPVSGSHDDYITRHVTGKHKDTIFEEKRVGFLWSWNYMLSKRWKTSTTPGLGDEAFMMKLLRDFQNFCNNDNNRLKTFWDYHCNSQLQ